MKAITITSLRKKLKTVIDNVINNSETVIIPRKDDQAAVLMSLDEYNSLTETAYLLRSEKNREHLLKSIEEVESNVDTIIKKV